MNEHTSRELSERLDEKAFRGEHEFSWMVSCVDGEPFCGSNENSVAHRRICPAYTFSELWGRVPFNIKQGRHIYWPNISRAGYLTEASYSRCEPSGWISPIFEHESPAEAMGLLVEWLLDNSYIEREG